jgi:4-amino-4-deoxy-L-arabinose transferase-like glycosyltransferase
MQQLPADSEMEKKWLYFLVALAVLVHGSGLWVTIMAPDAAIYAALSKHMALHNNYLELYVEGSDWLDKPHFPFWVTAFFFEMFGIHTWSYKLPGVLFVLLGAWYLWRLTRRLYDDTVALWAVFILLTAEHLLISNTDVRAEPFLTGLIIAAIYHYYRTVYVWSLPHLLAGSAFTACAVMTKGLFALIPVAGAIGGHLLLMRQWKNLWHIKWLVAAGLILLFITPELYSLWYQFDRHPEKVVFGRTGVSGIRFFFWDSQFGRFLNTGPIKGKGDPLFFLHTLLWAFLPWSLLMYGAFIRRVKLLWQQGQVKNYEWYAFCGSVLMILIFSISRFQLPHYTNIIFPLLAMLTAWHMLHLSAKSERPVRVLQYSVTTVALALPVLLHFVYRPVNTPMPALIVLVLLFILLLTLHRRVKTSGLHLSFMRSGLAVLLVHLYMNWIFYPDLMRYQSGSEAAFYMNKYMPNTPLVALDAYANGIEFYLDDRYIRQDTAAVKAGIPAALKQYPWYVSGEQLQLLEKQGYTYEVLKSWEHFTTTRLSLEFINQKTRGKTVQHYYLIRVQ